jgi:hypothetical protein
MKRGKFSYYYGCGGLMYVKFVKKSDNTMVRQDGPSTIGSIHLDVNNRGYKMLYKMGWDGKHQLGPTNNIAFNDPIIQKKYSHKHRRYGIGCVRKCK